MYMVLCVTINPQNLIPLSIRLVLNFPPPRSSEGRLGVGMGEQSTLCGAGGSGRIQKERVTRLRSNREGGSGGVRTHDPRGHGCGHYPLRHGAHEIETGMEADTQTQVAQRLFFFLIVSQIERAHWELLKNDA